MCEAGCNRLGTTRATVTICSPVDSLTETPMTSTSKTELHLIHLLFADLAQSSSSRASLRLSLSCVSRLFFLVWRKTKTATTTPATPTILPTILPTSTAVVGPPPPESPPERSPALGVVVLEAPFEVLEAPFGVVEALPAAGKLLIAVLRYDTVVGEVAQPYASSPPSPPVLNSSDTV